MKKIIFLLVLVLVGGFLIVFYGLPLVKYTKNLTQKSVCDFPITYKIGNIDSKYGITKDQLLLDVATSADVWNKTYGKNLFSYDPNSTLSINLIYDQRQSLNTKISTLEENLTDKQSNISASLEDYQKKRQDFNNKLSDFNKRVDSWNSQGGAPPEEYDKLISEQKSLKVEADSLNETARSLNQTADSFNSQVEDLNKTIGSLNEVLKDKPEEGIFDPNKNKIDIYFIIDKDELIHTLAHELGHARGLGHVKNKKAIMHSFTNKNLNLAEEDLIGLNKICAKNYLTEQAKNYIYYVYDQYFY